MIDFDKEEEKKRRGSHSNRGEDGKAHPVFKHKEGAKDRKEVLKIREKHRLQVRNGGQTPKTETTRATE